MTEWDQFVLPSSSSSTGVPVPPHTRTNSAKKSKSTDFGHILVYHYSHLTSLTTRHKTETFASGTRPGGRHVNLFVVNSMEDGGY